MRPWPAVRAATTDGVMWSMLRADKNGIFSKTYRITADGRDVTLFESSWWRTGGTFTLDGHDYTIRANMWGSRYGMADENDDKVASAQGVGRKHWTVESGDETHRFQRASLLRSAQLLLRDGQEVGAVERASMWKGGATAELPGLSLPVQVFVVAVVLTMWEQQASAAAASSSSGG